jgi:hypothetical protein
MTIEDLICQLDNPPSAFPDFAIRDGAKIGAERASEHPEYVFGALEGDAADKEKFFGHVVAPLTPALHVLFGKMCEVVRVRHQLQSVHRTD